MVKHAFPNFTASTFGAKPRLKTPADLAAAVAVIGSIDARTQAVEAHRKVQTDQLNEACAAELQMDVDGVLTPSDTYRSTLIAAIESYLPKAKQDIFGDTQTARFPCGEVSYKSKSAAVALAESVKAAEVADKLAKRKKLMDLLNGLLEQTGLEGWLRLKFELDLSAIQKRFRSGKLKKKDLPTGLTVVAAGETYAVKPYAAPDRLETSAA